MKYRKLGRTGLDVSEVGFGTWAIGGMWGPKDDIVAKKALNRGLDLGINFIDTALAYGWGHSEKLIGKVLQERNDGRKVFVATKIPPKDRRWPARHGTPVKEAFPAKWIRECTEQSLKNLGVETVDLTQLHVWATNWLKEDEPLQELRKLREEGKIRFFGISINDHEPDSALDVVSSGQIDTVQVIYNIFDQTPGEKLLPLCREKNVGVIVRVPFDEGGLTGGLKADTKFHPSDWRANYFKGERLGKTIERAERLKAYIDKDAPNLSRLSLKFCLASDLVSTVIPGMRRPAHVEDNCLASDGRTLKPAVIDSLKPHAWPRNFYS